MSVELANQNECNQNGRASLVSSESVETLKKEEIKPVVVEYCYLREILDKAMKRE